MHKKMGGFFFWKKKWKKSTKSWGNSMEYCFLIFKRRQKTFKNKEASNQFSSSLYKSPPSPQTFNKICYQTKDRMWHIFHSEQSQEGASFPSGLTQCRDSQEGKETQFITKPIRSKNQRNSGQGSWLSRVLHVCVQEINNQILKDREIWACIWDMNALNWKHLLCTISLKSDIVF